MDDKTNTVIGVLSIIYVAIAIVGIVQIIF